MPLAVSVVVRPAEPATRTGLAVLERHRDRVRHLADGAVADRDLALAVALFGSEPLRTTHPDFAALGVGHAPLAPASPRWRKGVA